MKKLRRKELAEARGVGIETLRYYESLGLLEPERDANGYRSYSAEHDKALRFILTAKECGFSLSEIKGFLSLLASPSSGRERIAEAIGAKLGELAAQAETLNARIALLRKLKANPRLGECETMAALRKKA